MLLWWLWSVDVMYVDRCVVDDGVVGGVAVSVLVVAGCGVTPAIPTP